MFLFPIFCPGAATKLGAFILLTVAFVLAIVLILILCFLLLFFFFVILVRALAFALCENSN